MPERTNTGALSSQQRSEIGDALNLIRQRIGQDPAAAKAFRADFEQLKKEWERQTESSLEPRPEQGNRFRWKVRRPGEGKNQSAGAVPGLSWESVGPGSGEIPDSLRTALGEIEDTPLLQRARLPFYRDAHLWHLCLLPEEKPAQDAYAIFINGQTAEPLRYLDWTNEPIYKLNDEKNFRFSSGLRAYVRCFFHLVRGQLGQRFIILENQEDVGERVPWRQDAEPSKLADDRRKVSEQAAPLQRMAVNAEGRSRFRAAILFNDGVFKSDIVVSASGLLSLEDDVCVEDKLAVEVEEAVSARLAAE